MSGLGELLGVLSSHVAAQVRERSVATSANPIGRTALVPLQVSLPLFADTALHIGARPLIGNLSLLLRQLTQGCFEFGRVAVSE